MPNTYDEVYTAMLNVLEARDRERIERYGEPRGTQDTRWPAWLQTVIIVGTIIVTITLAYATLDKRVALVEQKIDYIIRMVK
jgi:hypothetical protein